MRSLALIFALICAVTVLVSAHPHDRCGGRWNGNPFKMLMSIPKLNSMASDHKDEFSMLRKMFVDKMEDEVESCLDFKFPDEWMEVHHKCMITYLPVLVTKGVIEKSMPNITDFGELLYSQSMCKMKKMDIIDMRGIIDLEKLKTIYEKAAITGDDAEIVRKDWMDCFNKESKPSSYMESWEMMKRVERCGTKKMMDRCGKEVSCMYPIHYSMTTAMEEGKCSQVKVNPNFESTAKNCMTEGAAKLQRKMEDMNLFPSIFPSVMNMIKRRGPRDMTILDKINKIKDIAEPIRKEMKSNCADATRCLLRGLGFVDGDNFDTNAYVDYYSAFEGWDTDILNEYIKKEKECVDTFGIKINDGLISGMNDDDTLNGMWDVCIKCKLPALADTCGVNNELTKFFLPFTNNKILEHWVATMRSTFQKMTLSMMSSRLTAASDSESLEDSSIEEDGML